MIYPDALITLCEYLSDVLKITFKPGLSLETGATRPGIHPIEEYRVTSAGLNCAQVRTLISELHQLGLSAQADQVDLFTKAEFRMEFWVSPSQVSVFSEHPMHQTLQSLRAKGWYYGQGILMTFLDGNVEKVLSEFLEYQMVLGRIHSSFPITDEVQMVLQHFGIPRSRVSVLGERSFLEVTDWINKHP